MGFITLKVLSYSRICIANVVFGEYFVFCLQDKRVYCLAIKLRTQKLIGIRQSLLSFVYFMFNLLNLLSGLKFSSIDFFGGGVCIR